jgi:mannosyltransferase OCH1-like enzyme
MALIETWKALNPDFQHYLFNSETAMRFLIENYSREAVVAYQRATEPAQKSDLFRLAWLFAKGGYYADADDRCLSRIDTLAPAHVNLVLYQEEYGTVGNNFIAVTPRHPVIGRALQHAVNSINRGDRDLIWLATGPGLLTRALVETLTQDDSWRAALKRVAILHRGKLSQGVASHCIVAYKRTGRHWSRSAFQIKSKTKNFRQCSQPPNATVSPATA